MAKSGAKRKTSNRNLPRYLYRDEKGYFSYRDRYIGKTIGLGKDEERAIAYALEENAKRRHPAVAQAEMVDAPQNHAVFTQRQIVEMAIPFRLVTGIYFLILDGEIVYVGQSIDCTGRLSDHAKDMGKPFDSIYIIDAEADELNHLEGYYIRLFRPIYNAMVPGKSRPIVYGK